MIDNISISVQGNSTEAGLRQTLKNDALNVIFDEAEGETDDAQARIQNVMGLMRAASAHAGAPILKGSKSGTSQSFRIRSCFAFASIVPQIVHDSDKRRVTVLEIAKHKNAQRFKDIEKKRIELLTDDYVRKFQARMILNLDKILESIKIFTDTIAVEIGDRALGDQLGAMLGGWWHCNNDEVVTDGQAIAIIIDLVKALNIGDEESKDLTDEERCLQFLLSAEEFVQGEYTGTASVGELVEVVSSGTFQTRIQHQDADRKLKMLGLKVVEQNGVEYLAVLNTSAWVLSRLKGTAWTKSHSQVLSRIPGTIKKQMRFSSGVKGRSILIPMNYVL
jgi:putative DNA primase/helicase